MSFVSERRFCLWDCNISHKQLLLRSPRTPEIATNIDIVLWGVEFLQLPTVLDGVAMTRPRKRIAKEPDGNFSRQAATHLGIA